MKHFVFILFILLTSHVIHAADPAEVSARALPVSLSTLLKEEQKLFEVKPLFSSRDGLVQFVAPERLTKIHKAVLRITNTFEDSNERAYKIKILLDNAGIWHKGVQLFLMGTEIWANLVAIENGEKKDLMVIDPSMLPGGPAPLSDWFNLYAREYQKLSLLRNPGEKPIPPEKDLNLVIRTQVPKP